MSERCGPVRDSKPGLIAGDQSPGDQQKKGDTGQENQKAMECLVISCCGRQKKLPEWNLIIVAKRFE